MSAETIARWNAIPLERPQDDSPHPLKRQREHDDSKDEGTESEDNVSIVSRSPSPSSRDPNAMSIDKYDEYVNGEEREVITVNTRIKASNKGFMMLANMGWSDGQPLGLAGDGRVDPVPFYVKNDLTGLGKANQDVRMIESTVSQRRGLEVERQTKETEEQRKAREDAVAKKAALQSEISSTLKAFYCELCEKQFQNVAQYDEHTNSYAHHHKARFRDMQLAQRANRNTQEELEKRKEKERKREEKELRKLAKAAGIKLAKPPVSLLAPTAAAEDPSTTTSAGDSEARPAPVKKSGWATVSSPATPATSAESAAAAAPAVPSSSTSGSKRSGWATVGATASEASTSASPSTSASTAAGGATYTSSSQAQRDPAPPSQQEESAPSRAAPSFRTGGWTSLDTGSTISPAPTPHPPPSPPPSAPPEPAPANSHLQPPRSGFASIPPAVPSAPSSDTRDGWSSATSHPIGSSQPARPDSVFSMPPDPAPPASNLSNKPARTQPQLPTPPSHTSDRRPPAAIVRQEASRSGWQQFRAGAPGRRR